MQLVNCHVTSDLTVFSDIPRVNLSFDKLAYTGSDSCFVWLETQGTGIHFTVELVVNVSFYAFHFPFCFNLVDTWKRLLV